ncbi:NAD(P)H-dependent oxidoreductase [Erwinia sp. V71]|uniref:NAD(P)H-dependent oxidoreductase n=1 Tax=Erwinia sp. V71 TaxID=3369424 RepID=UPI003F63C635
MHAHIVVSHPLADSLTHRVAQQIAAGVQQHAGHSAQIHDLRRNGFDPRFNAADMAAFQKQAPIPADVVAEQQKIAAADALVLVYPVYWWSLPGLLKGWIDRVFCNGWAYDDDMQGKLVKKLGHLPVHLVALGAADSGTWQRHGYRQAMQTQIDHGIFDYCGAPVASSTVLLQEDIAQHLEKARQLGKVRFNRQL